LNLFPVLIPISCHGRIFFPVSILTDPHDTRRFTKSKINKISLFFYQKHDIDTDNLLFLPFSKKYIYFASFVF
jgi:hypothetical protein